MENRTVFQAPQAYAEHGPLVQRDGSRSASATVCSADRLPALAGSAIVGQSSGGSSPRAVPLHHRRPRACHVAVGAVTPQPFARSTGFIGQRSQKCPGNRPASQLPAVSTFINLTTLNYLLGRSVPATATVEVNQRFQGQIAIR